MNCQTVTRLIEYYTAGDIPQKARIEFESHLRGCAACRTCVTEFTKLSEVLTTIPAEVVPAHLAANIQQQVRSRLWRRRLVQVIPTAVASICSLLVCLWLASETWFALQDRALWELVQWSFSVPDILWEHPGEVLAGFVDFAPIGGIVFTLASALSSWWFVKRLIGRLESQPQRVS